ncbi:hypothetical protein NS355_10240 [Sphingomonas yabuuchiae]|uniref:Uncharacterized protein n=1 Tax=Sphingomonas yabuuchiae TaxID=172044 RepID=A0A147IRC0_9SPHN|nr:hypothetical protein NS355_10240 [Sphingomonas yabuuchiae]
MIVRFEEDLSMLFTIVSLLIAPMAAQPAPSKSVCDVGRAILADMRPWAGDETYLETDPERSGLMKLCPDLRTVLPSGYRMVNDDARRRADIHAPLPGPRPIAAYIYAIGSPIIATDGRSATVEVLCTCTGLCGSATRSRYIRTPQGWRRDGKPRMLWVS